MFPEYGCLISASCRGCKGKDDIWATNPPAHARTHARAHTANWVSHWCWHTTRGDAFQSTVTDQAG